jgi:tetratricopeptide (TPR) repeat protein
LGFAKFILWTGLKTLGLIFLGLLAAKAISALRSASAPGRRDRLFVLRSALYLAVVLLVMLGANYLGRDVAAENYARASSGDLDRHQYAKAYENARRAVELRPDVLPYWEGLANAKFALRQYASVVADLPVFLALGRGQLAEDDGIRLATAYYLLAQYDKVPPLTQAMVAANRSHAAPYILEGYTYMAQRRYGDAEKIFLAVLQMFPTQQAAVEGLAHTHFLSGNRAAALAVLDQTSRFPFPPEARRRFEALKALYAQ